jgi:prepilin-type N-terminal cleavage/methylation domain-containing protein
MHIRRGLTIIEFLVVLAIVAVIVAIMLPSLPTGPHRALRTQCAANLKAIGQTLFMYAAENSDNLPQFSAPASPVWLTDQHPSTFATFSMGASTTTTASLKVRKFFYCLGNASQDPATWWSNSSRNILGYVFLNDRGAAATVSALPVRPATMSPLAYHTRVNGVRRPGDTEFVFDLLVSDSGSASSFMHTSVVRSLSTPLSYQSSHPSSAYGANILCLDGHVESRNFTPARAVSIQQPNSTPVYFWLPNP